MLESAVRIVTVIFLMIGVGYIFQRKGWFGKNAPVVLSRLTLRIGMPGLIFSNIFSNYSRDMLISGAYSLLVPLAVMTVMYVASAPLARLLHIPRDRQGVFRALFTFGNSLFIGMPVCRAIFGEAGVSDVLFYYLLNTSFWWLVGAPAVARDGGAKTQNPFTRLASPPLITCFVSISLLMAGVTPPEFIMTTAGYLGGMVTPLSMLFIGSTLYSMLSHGLRWQKGYGAILIGRAVLGPLICLPLCFVMEISGNMLGVFFLQSGMPSQTQSCLWAQEKGADAEYAAGAIALSTLLGLVAIPAYAWILGYIIV